ncbi:MAG: hypothetical protein JO164_12315 [Candidatus Eremiobacteraeota bacterium]|nr:hypothetical protein [Candidatus Eremiobacteraeota bacterium]
MRKRAAPTALPAESRRADAASAPDRVRGLRHSLERVVDEPGGRPSDRGAPLQRMDRGAAAASEDDDFSRFAAERHGGGAAAAAVAVPAAAAPAAAAPAIPAAVAGVAGAGGTIAEVEVGEISPGLPGRIVTRGLGDCIAVVGYSAKNNVAVMAHVNIPGQALAGDDQALRAHRAEYERVRSVILTRLGPGYGEVAYHIVRGRMWQLVEADLATGGYVWSISMKGMLLDVFRGATWGAPGAIATWDGNTLTPS